MIQAIGYVRCSTDKQDESLDQQRAKLQSFAKSKGWKLVEVFADDAISGSDLKRPGLDQLMRTAERRKDVDVVIAWDRNRLARPKDPVDGLMLERKLMAAGKRVVYAATGHESDRSFASGLISYVEHYQNGDYLRKLSRDTMRGIVSRVERGRWPGGPIPFGYDRLILDDTGKPKRIIRDLDDGSQAVIDPRNGELLEHIAAGRRYAKQDHEACTLIPSDPARIRAVRRIFADYVAGKPFRVIRDWLNAAGFRTSRGSPFSLATLHPLIANPAYVGDCVYNRRTLSKWHRHTGGQSVERAGEDERIEKRPESDWIIKSDAWDAIIDRDTFEQAQSRRKESATGYQTAGRAARSEYLLVGRIYCGVCGGRMFGITRTSGKGYKTRYYTCTNHHNGRHDLCPKRYSVPLESVEGFILDIIKADLAKLRDDRKLHGYIADELRRMQGGNADGHQQLQRRMADLDQQAAKLRDHLLKVDPEVAESLGLYGQAKLIADERKDVEKKLAATAIDPAGLPSPAEIRRMACEHLDQLENTLAHATIEEKRALIGRYVKEIKADPDLQEVRIGLFSTLFNCVIAGVGFEPTTSGL